MTDGPSRSRSPRTTAVGGLLLVVAAAILLIEPLGLVFAIAEPLPVPLSGPGFSITARALLLAAALVLALGLRGEPGVAGRSAPGRVALIAGAAVPVLLDALVVVPFPTAAGIVVVTVLVVAGPLAAVLGAAAVARARVLTGPARWALLPTAIVRLLLALLGLVPAVELVPVLDALSTAAALLLLAAGVALLLDGRTAAVRRRMERVRAEW